MLIVLEGIDGSGKTTIAELVRNKLSKKVPCYPTDKKRVIATGDIAKAKLESLKDIIWNDHETEHDPFSTYFWLKLIAAWYSHMEPKSEQFAKGLRVYDGWYFRNIVKSSLRCDASPEWLHALFDDVAKPDVTFLLDLDPHIAWERDRNKKNTELGRWDGFEGSDEEAFCAYQEILRGKLLMMAKTHNWVVLSCFDGETRAELAERITKELAKISLQDW